MLKINSTTGTVVQNFLFYETKYKEIIYITAEKNLLTVFLHPRSLYMTLKKRCKMHTWLRRS